MTRATSWAWLPALLLSALGIAALPHADLNEHALAETWVPTSLLTLAAWHLLGIGLGLLAYVAAARLDWSRLRAINPWWWLAAAVVLLLLPLLWREVSHLRLTYFGGVDTFIVAMPFLAVWAAGMNERLGEGGPPPGCCAVLLAASLMVAVSVLAAPVLPLFALLSLPLLLAMVVPRLRRIGWTSLVVLVVLLVRAIDVAPYEDNRYMELLLPMFHGQDYALDHLQIQLFQILGNIDWLGGGGIAHLPHATTNFMEVSLAKQWGGLAFAGVLILMGLWFAWVKPRQAAEDNAGEYRDVFARFLWLGLLLAALSSVGGNLLLLSVQGAGLPVFSGNWGLLLMAWLLMGVNDPNRSKSSDKWLLFGGGVLLAIAVLVLARQPPTSTENPHLRAFAARSLEKAMTENQAEIGGVVVLDAQSGAILTLEGRAAKGSRRFQGDFNAVYQHVFAPEHTLSPILAATLIERGLIQPDTLVDTRPLRRKGLRIEDERPVKPGSTLREVVAWSSRAGAARMALMLEPEDYLRTLSDLGFATSLGYANERSGKLEGGVNEVSRMLLGVAPAGGGIEVNLLQLAQAYLALAGDGHARKVFSEPGARPRTAGDRVFQPETTRKVRDLLAGPVNEGGTAQLAAVEGLSVGGKTGSISNTARLRGRERQTALFVGMAPLEAPRYVIAVMLERQSVAGSEPMFGGLAAAPVFAEIVKSLFPAAAGPAQAVSSGS